MWQANNISEGLGTGSWVPVHPGTSGESDQRAPEQGIQPWARNKRQSCDRPALPQQVEDVVSESVSVLLQHPPHVVHHLQHTAGGVRELTGGETTTAAAACGRRISLQLFKFRTKCFCEKTDQMNIKYLWQENVVSPLLHSVWLQSSAQQHVASHRKSFSAARGTETVVLFIPASVSTLMNTDLKQRRAYRVLAVQLLQ